MKNNMKAAVAVILIAAALTGCGTIKPPTIDNTVTTVPVTTEAVTTTIEPTTVTATTEAPTEPPMSEEEKRKLEQSTFIAEFLGSQIKFEDTAGITDEVIKKSNFECASSKNGTEKITVKGKNGGGTIEVSRIDISASSLKNDLENVLGRKIFYLVAVHVGIKKITGTRFNLWLFVDHRHALRKISDCLGQCVVNIRPLLALVIQLKECRNLRLPDFF